MDETANEIESHIDRTRERLGSNLRELEDRVDEATDWQEHFRARPQIFLGAAFAGGVILATALRAKASNREHADTQVRGAVNGSGAVHAQATELWYNIQGALIGVASARIKQYIGQLVPGFDEHYRRAEQRAATFDPTRTSLGRSG
jgi:Holliday junction resolvasome RuvABC endonuclease subunit